MSAITSTKETTLTIFLFKNEPQPIEVAINEQFHKALKVLNRYADTPVRSIPLKVTEYYSAQMSVPSSRIRAVDGVFTVIIGAICGLYVAVQTTLYIKENRQIIGTAEVIIGAIAGFYLFIQQEKRKDEKIEKTQAELTTEMERSWSLLIPSLKNKENLLLTEVQGLEGNAAEQKRVLDQNPRASFAVEQIAFKNLELMEAELQESKQSLKACFDTLTYFQGLNATRIANEV